MLQGYPDGGRPYTPYHYPLLPGWVGKCTSDEGNGVYDLMDLLKNAEEMDEVPDEINDAFKEDDVALVLWSSAATG